MAAETDTYDVVLCGFGEGLAESPAVGLKRVFGVDDAAANKLLEGLPRKVQRGVPLVRAEYFRRALKLIGAEVEVHAPDGSKVADPEPAKLEVPAPAQGLTSADSLTTRALAPTDRPDARPSATPAKAATRTVAQVAAPVVAPPAAGEPRAPAHPTLREGAPAPVASAPAAPVAAPAAASPGTGPSGTAVAKSPAVSSAEPSLKSAWGSIDPGAPDEPVAAGNGAGVAADTVFDAGDAAAGGSVDTATRLDPAPEAAGSGTPDGGLSLPGMPASDADAGVLRVDRFGTSDSPPADPPKDVTFHAHEVEHPKPKFDVSERIGANGMLAAPQAPAHSSKPAAPSSFDEPPEPPTKRAAGGKAAGLAVSSDSGPAPKGHGWLASLDVEGERKRGAAGSAATRKAPVKDKERAKAREAAKTRAAAQTRKAGAKDEPRLPRAAEAAAQRAATRAAPRAEAAASAAASPVPVARRSIPDLRGFWVSIFDGIALPFHGGGPYWIVAITIWTVIVSLIGVLASFAPHYSIGLTVSFFTMTSALAFSCDFFRVALWVPKMGERAIEGGPGLEPERILHVYFKSGLLLSSFGLLLVLPAIWWAYDSLAPDGFSDPNALFELALHPVTWLLLVLPGVYWPMGVALTALTNSFASIWNVPLVVRGILRAPAEYFVVASIGHLAFLVTGGGLLLVGSSMGLTGELAQSTLGLPLAVSHGIHGALMGHLVRARPDVLEA